MSAHRSRSVRKFRPQLEPLEPLCLMDAGLFRSIDGIGNNLVNVDWGSAGADLLRIAAAAYADGVSAPAGADRAGARLISNTLSDQADPNNPTEDLSVVNQKGLSDFIYVFGQFLDHDLDLTTANSGIAFDIAAGSATDPMGTESFTRSDTDPATGTSISNPLQQINAVTSFLDGSQIYGSTAARADALRTHVGGRLKTSVGADGIIGTAADLLPYDNSTYFPDGTLTMANDAHIVSDGQLFAAGDVRANENIELTSMQTLFVREHNRIAAQLQAAHPGWSDEQLYQQARRVVIAELEIITYNEWLPALLGPNALPQYTGYKSNVDPEISNEFSTALFRFAHSQLDNDIDRLNNNGTKTAAGNVDLAQAFFNPTLISGATVIDPISGQASTGIDAILKGAASGDAQEVDLLSVSDIRNFLFGAPGAGGTDLIARDIQRGRDHGLTDYNSMRAAYGLPRVTSFAQITSDVTVQQKLEELYGTVDNIDAFVGALAEDHVAGADVGPLTTAVFVNQFTRLRDGDRFFYLNQFTGTELTNLLANTSLTKIIERNSGITNLQSNAFYFKASINGSVLTRTAGRNATLRGLPGITVRLLDDSGAAVATTVTDSRGRYHLDSLSGVEGTGYYRVQVLTPAGKALTSAAILISRGDVNISGVNFTIGTTSHGSFGTNTTWIGDAALDEGSAPGTPLRHGPLTGLNKIGKT